MHNEERRIWKRSYCQWTSTTPFCSKPSDLWETRLLKHHVGTQARLFCNFIVSKRNKVRTNFEILIEPPPVYRRACHIVLYCIYHVACSDNITIYIQCLYLLNNFLARSFCTTQTPILPVDDKMAHSTSNNVHCTGSSIKKFAWRRLPPPYKTFLCWHARLHALSPRIL